MIHSAPRCCAVVYRARWPWLAAIAIASVTAGCQGTLPPSETSPARTPGESQSPSTLSTAFEVAHFRTTTSDITRVLVDRSGVGHVIIGIKESRQIQHVLVGPDGVLGRETVATGVKAGSFDAAFDGSGGLHILIDGEHYAKVDGAWRANVRTPWQEAGLEARGRSFVAGSKDLIWQFLVAGEDVGAPGRWDLIVGSFFMVPWRSHGWKLVVVPEATPAYTSWTILDPRDNSVVDSFWTASAADGAITLLYEARGSGLRYAQFDIAAEPLAANSAISIKNGRTMRSITGTSSTLSAEWMSHGVCSTAARDGATRLFVQENGASRLVHGDTWGGPIALPLSSFHDVRLASAGNNNFHALVTGKDRHPWSWNPDRPLLYLTFSNGAWSEPIEIASPTTAVDAISLGSDAGSKALAVWPTDTGIIGRWITLETK